MSKSDIGKVFSSSDDSDDYSSAATSRKNLQKTSLRIPMTSASEQESKPSKATEVAGAADIDLSKYTLINNKQYGSIPKNTKIIYIKASGAKTQNKYFKQLDPIDHSIIVGFYLNDRRNYTVKISDIDQLYILTKDTDTLIEDPLKNTIEIKLSELKKILQRDMVVSYQKKDDEWVYHAKFNAFVKSTKDQSSRMSMTSARGFNFTLNPANINKIYRHISGSDKTTTIILQNFQVLAQKVSTIEKKLDRLDARLVTIERKINGSKR